MMQKINFWKMISVIFIITLFILLFDFNINLRGIETRTFSSSEKEINYKELSSDIIPVGVPEVYGEGLSIRYDDVSVTNAQSSNIAIDKMANLDLELSLEGEDLDRYIEILYKKEGGMSCEFCCGAFSIIFEDGEPACGCMHSFAMRGLTKHLILEYGDIMSNDDILEEVGKWKVLYFPEIHIQKAKIMEEEGIEVDYISLTSNRYREIEKTGSSSSQGGMVGDC